MLRSGTSVAAHYREACRARSDAEFTSKIDGGLQELDETSLWLEILVESRHFDQPAVHSLVAEADELLRILTTISKSKKH